MTDPDTRSIYVAAAKAHVGRMKRLEERVGDRLEKGQELPLGATTAEDYRLEAEGLIFEYDRSTVRRVEEMPRAIGDVSSARTSAARGGLLSLA